jgi:hypothetical protein
MFNKTIKMFGIDQQILDTHLKQFARLQAENENKVVKFKEVENVEIILGDEYCYKKVQTKGMWSGKFELPQIGTEVELGINSFGRAKVVSYYAQAGFIGIQAELPLLNNPMWRCQQCYPRYGVYNPPVIAFGAEIIEVYK